MKKNHLTEKDLIEYQFKLTSKEQIAEAEEHLKQCEKCRQVNERLAAKFSSLEMLREEPQLSEELVSRILKNIKSSRRAKLKLKTFKIPVWISAAAAFFLVASLLVVSEIREQRKNKITKGLGVKQPQRTQKFDYGDRETADERDGEIRKDSRRSGRNLSAGEQIASIEEGDKSPIASASEIVPVVRPSRENVQIAFHDSTDLTLAGEKRNLALQKGWKLADQDGNWQVNLNNGWQIK